MDTTVNRLLDAAENGMRLGGYHAVSFRNIADELGIKSASVHYHFRQKEDLGLALVKRYSDGFFADLEKRSENRLGPRDRLEAFCKTYQHALNRSDKICLCGLLGAETCGLPETLGLAIAEFFRANINWIVKELPVDISTKQKRAKATQVVATLQGAMMLSISLKDLKYFDNAVSALLSDLEF